MSAQVRVPKLGWVRFRWSRAVPAGQWNPAGVTRDRACRWHVAFTAVPAPIPAPGNGQTVGIDRGVAVSAALSTGELLRVPGLGGADATRMLRAATQARPRPARLEPPQAGAVTRSPG